MKKLYVGIFACCFWGALQAADSAETGKPKDDSATAPKIVGFSVTNLRSRFTSTSQPTSLPAQQTKASATLPIDIVPQAQASQTSRSASPIRATLPLSSVALETPSSDDIVTNSSSGAPLRSDSSLRHAKTASEISSNVLLQAAATQSESPLAKASNSARKSLTPLDDRHFKSLDDDAHTIGADGEGYESDGSTFDDAIHVSAEQLATSRMWGGYGYSKVCALVAAIKKSPISEAKKNAKIQNTPAFLASALSDINTTATAEELDIILGFVIDKNRKGAKLVSRHHLSGTRDAAIRHEEAALAKTALEQKATEAQDARVKAAQVVLATEEAKLAACKEKTRTLIPNLARREATTQAVQALMRVEPPTQLFGTLELPEDEAAKLIPANLDYEALIHATAQRKALLRPTASSSKAQLK